MSELETSPSGRKCPQCGAELPGNVPPELCPKCLLKTGMGTQPATGPNGTVTLTPREAKSRGLPQPGEQFGHYRIGRLLGQGGMGAAFEADDLDTGRCVALKVLSHTLDSPDARERFFREGRLAASINHPNSVYVFGTEEIGGTPVIAMELVSGGTLQDRVRAQGPLPVGEAVDAMLQIIAGLEAAQRIGILHRDVKPSNCFRDAEGTVKIGDFGLSISTAIRLEPALTSAGEFLGTPAFCSPEQLRGDELNARSDMYSVGATLFYLLTGRTPFEAKNTVQLLATVLEQPAPSPRKFRAEIPPSLARVILRCLEKQSSERFKSYASLTRALAPYSSAAPTPATLGLRFLAGTLDFFAPNLVTLPFMLLAFENVMNFLDATGQPSLKLFGLMLAGFAVVILYYAVMEGFWGFTVGKAICRLRVVRLDKNPPGFPRALLRAVVYIGLPVLPFWVVYGLIYGGNPKVYASGSNVTQFLMGFSYYVLLALLFCTARRRNGFAAVQDLLTKTRVISRAAIQARPLLASIEMPPPAVESRATVGPYHVLETLEQSASGEWLLGYDLRLLRKVWIRKVTPATPPVPARLRNTGRVGRLRWLTGRRSPEENWDAFEAVTGKPLVGLIQTPQPWSEVRFWLYDLAAEISAAEKDGTLPPVLALDRVWITGDGRAKLLDFPAPRVESRLPLTPSLSPSDGERVSVKTGEGHVQHFLGQVAAAALAGRAEANAQVAVEVAIPLPLHARTFLKKLPQLLDTVAVLSALKPLLTRVAVVSRLRRAAMVAGCLAFPALACCSVILGINIMDQWSRSNPGLMKLQTLLQQRTAMHIFGRKSDGPTDRQFAIYIAGHYGAIVTNNAAWSSAFTLAMINGESRQFAEKSVAEHPAPTEKEIAEADHALKPYLPKRDMFGEIRKPWFPLVGLLGALAIYVGIPALIAALLFRGGLVLLIAGVTYVRKDGARASRLRLLWRAMVVWGPVFPILFVMTYELSNKHWVWQPWLLAMALLGLLAVLSVALPKRGLQDRLAGTWPVPR
ncbi:MAG: protein kinase [Verrucomicrobia bacterium]|jgi:hypothetical protein|nr:protein kinase [Verrucomicrobiota bacterium]